MKERAIEKLQGEIKGAKMNTTVQRIGEYLISYVQSHPEAAEKILVDDKTIAKSVDAMRQVAMKQQVKGVAVLTDDEGFAIVLKYFELTGKAEPRSAARPIQYEQTSLFDLKLEDLL